MKYIIEIEDVPFSKVRFDTDNAQNINLYRAKGFNALVFDKNGLDKLTPLDKELEETYQRGFDDGKNKKEDGCVGCKYDDGMTEHSPCDYCCNAYSNQWTAKEKADEIKVGDIITDGKINYLVIDITNKSYIALQGTDFEPIYIGKDLNLYYNLHDSKDMQKIAEEINRMVKGEQRNCHTCKYHVACSIECVDCYGFGKWEPKEGAE